MREFARGHGTSAASRGRRPRGAAGPAHLPRRARTGRMPRRLAPRKHPTQRRARETVEAILAAATALFATHGYARTTTNGVADRAGVSIGSLYQYFPNKDALLAALHERHEARVGPVIARSLVVLADPAVTLERGLGALVRALGEAHDADPALTRAVAVQSPQVPPLGSRQRKQAEHYVGRIETLLSGRSDVRPGDRRVMARVLVQATESLTRWLVHDLPPEVDRRVVGDEVVRMLWRYLAG
jgi:AcrR family transcriptional regulator